MASHQMKLILTFLSKVPALFTVTCCCTLAYSSLFPRWIQYYRMCEIATPHTLIPEFPLLVEIPALYQYALSLQIHRKTHLCAIVNRAKQCGLISWPHKYIIIWIIYLYCFSHSHCHPVLGHCYYSIESSPLGEGSKGVSPVDSPQRKQSGIQGIHSFCPDFCWLCWRWIAQLGVALPWWLD